MWTQNICPPPPPLKIHILIFLYFHLDFLLKKMFWNVFSTVVLHIKIICKIQLWLPESSFMLKYRTVLIPWWTFRNFFTLFFSSPPSADRGELEYFLLSRLKETEKNKKRKKRFLFLLLLFSFHGWITVVYIFFSWWDFSWKDTGKPCSNGNVRELVHQKYTNSL